MGRRVKTEPPSLRCPERSHAVGAQDLGDTADELEETHQPLEGVLPVDGAGEPPDAHPRETQDGREALDLAQSPFAGPLRHVGPVELGFFPGAVTIRVEAAGAAANLGPRSVLRCRATLT